MAPVKMPCPDTTCGYTTVEMEVTDGMKLMESSGPYSGQPAGEVREGDAPAVGDEGRLRDGGGVQLLRAQLEGI